MTKPSPRGLFGPRFARDLWRLTRIYWTSKDAPIGALLLLGAITLELLTVQASVLIADAERQIFDALGDRDVTAFFGAMGLFLIVIGGFVASSTLRIYVRARLEIRWRERVTVHFVEQWMGPEAYCQTELDSTSLDNPDQRIAEDARNYVASALGLSLSLLSAVATLYSFGWILWRMSANWPVRVFGVELWIPGLMLWVAIFYALVATFVTHLVGRSLVPINFDRLRYEADFRYGLVHFRDNAEAVALARGQHFERRKARGRFGRVIDNWIELIGAQARLTLFTTGIGQANGLIPILIGAPAYFARHLTLGSLAQTRIAYGQLSAALAWFVNAYQEIAQWRASIARLSAFLDSLDETRERLAAAGLRVEPGAEDVLRLDNVRLDAPDGRVLLAPVSATLRAGERVAVVGPAGAGKTTLLRAIAGIWPYGAGRIEVPARARMMFLTQQPYIPLGTLREALTYPSPADAFPDAKVREVLSYVGLGRLAHALDREDIWEHVLSGEESRRVVFARVLLHEPDWIFGDDATGSLDEATERRVYDILHERLPHATLVSITQHAAAVAYHDRRWTLVPRENGVFALQTA
ncbi:MAG TPA: ABC transporter ATP-binding protein/permease [Candidatus Limnocylindria bacterium]|nr:ABC transporter ATP-binding protein/permease [Candidatus Limnocylindria bacterium]